MDIGELLSSLCNVIVVNIATPSLSYPNSPLVFVGLEQELLIEIHICYLPNYLKYINQAKIK